MPVEPGIIYEKLPFNTFRWESLMDKKRRKFSKLAIQCLNKMEAEIVEREFTDTYVDPESQETRTRTF